MRTEAQNRAQRKWRAKNPDKVREYNARRPGRTDSVKQARSYARQLMRGERILSYHNHHTGMAKLKEWMGDPRPEGMTLSLVSTDSPHVYAGRNSKREPRLMSTSAADYTWESQADNLKRR